MDSYTLLDQSTEDSLHKSRLLNVEEKPFKRITKRLLTPSNPLVTFPILPPTPPPDTSAADLEAAALEATRQQQLDERRQFREDVILDFSAFDSSIARIQFLLTSNALERQRYAEEKVKIQNLSQSVRDNTTKLRQQLVVAQETLARRKAWDVLTEKITSNRLLRPRDEQHQSLQKLRDEIDGLEAEAQAYKQTWVERRAQFERIVQEGLLLRKLIRDEKEEVERREGMEGEGDEHQGHDGDGDEEGRGSGSVVGTPRPDHGGATPMHGVIEVSSSVGASTPSGGGGGGNLMVEKQRARGMSPLMTVKATAKGGGTQKGEEQDSVMGDAANSEGDEGEVSESEQPTRAPSVTGDDADEEERERRGDGEEDGEREEGEQKPVGDQMDTT